MNEIEKQGHLETRNCSKCQKEGWVGSDKNERTGNILDRLYITIKGILCGGCIDEPK